MVIFSILLMGERSTTWRVDFGTVKSQAEYTASAALVMGRVDTSSMIGVEVPRLWMKEQRRESLPRIFAQGGRLIQSDRPDVNRKSRLL